MTEPRGGGAPPAPAADGVGRSTAVFALWTAVSRVAGLVREIVAAALFGTSGPINAFVIAFQAPNVVRSLVADSALSAAFVPVFTQLQEEGRDREAKRLAGALLGVTTLALGIVSALAIVTAPWVMPLIAPGLSESLQGDLVLLTQIMFPIVLLLGITGIVVAIQQASGIFAPSAFAPVLWNIVILASLLVGAVFVSGGDRVYVYAIGIVLGTAAQLAYLVPHIRGLGPFPPSLRITPHLKRVLVLMVPVTLGLGLININALIDASFATLVSDDAVRAIDAAFRLYILPQGIFSVAIATVLFPAISRMAARGDRAGMREAVGRGIRQIVFLLAPATAFLMVLAEPVVRLVYQRGQFTAESTSLTAEALFYFTIGLTFNGASLLVIRAFFSLQMPGIPTKVALAGAILNIALDAALYQPLGVGGIPLSTSIVSIVTFLILVRLLSRELGGLPTDLIMTGVWQSVAGAALAGLFAWELWRAVDDAIGQGTLAQLVSVGLAMAGATVAYLATALAFRMPELRDLSRLARPLR